MHNKILWEQSLDLYFHTCAGSSLFLVLLLSLLPFISSDYSNYYWNWYPEGSHLLVERKCDTDHNGIFLKLSCDEDSYSVDKKELNFWAFDKISSTGILLTAFHSQSNTFWCSIEDEILNGLFDCYYNETFLGSKKKNYSVFEVVPNCRSHCQYLRIPQEQTMLLKIERFAPRFENQPIYRLENDVPILYDASNYYVLRHTKDKMTSTTLLPAKVTKFEESQTNLSIVIYLENEITYMYPASSCLLFRTCSSCNDARELNCGWCTNRCINADNCFDITKACSTWMPINVSPLLGKQCSYFNITLDEIMSSSENVTIDMCDKKSFTQNVDEQTIKVRAFCDEETNPSSCKINFSIDFYDDVIISKEYPFIFKLVENYKLYDYFPKVINITQDTWMQYEGENVGGGYQHELQFVFDEKEDRPNFNCQPIERISDNKSKCFINSSLSLSVKEGSKASILFEIDRDVISQNSNYVTFLSLPDIKSISPTQIVLNQFIYYNHNSNWKNFNAGIVSFYPDFNTTYLLHKINCTINLGEQLFCESFRFTLPFLGISINPVGKLKDPLSIIMKMAMLSPFLNEKESEELLQKNLTLYPVPIINDFNLSSAISNESSFHTSIIVSGRWIILESGLNFDFYRNQKLIKPYLTEQVSPHKIAFRLNSTPFGSWKMDVTLKNHIFHYTTEQRIATIVLLDLLLTIVAPILLVIIVVIALLVCLVRRIFPKNPSMYYQSDQTGLKEPKELKEPFSPPLILPEQLTSPEQSKLATARVSEYFRTPTEDVATQRPSQVDQISRISYKTGKMIKPSAVVENHRSALPSQEREERERREEREEREHREIEKIEDQVDIDHIPEYATKTRLSEQRSRRLNIKSRKVMDQESNDLEYITARTSFRVKKPVTAYTSLTSVKSRDKESTYSFPGKGKFQLINDIFYSRRKRNSMSEYNTIPVRSRIRPKRRRRRRPR